MTRTAAVFLLATQACGQHLEIGAIGAGRPTSQLEGYGVSESRRYLVGPLVRFNLPRGFAVEANALYSRFGYTSTSTDIVGDFYTTRSRANSRQFPILLKYRLRIAALGPYVLVGWDPERATGTSTGTMSLVSNPYDPNSTRTYRQFTTSDNYGTNHGLVAGAGVAFGSRHLRVSPEVRYVRWKDPMFSNYGSRGFYLLVPQNEVQLILGVAWR